MSYQSQIPKIWMSEGKIPPFSHKDSVIFLWCFMRHIHKLFQNFCWLCLYWLFSSESSWILWRYLILFPGVFFSSMSFSRTSLKKNQKTKKPTKKPHQKNPHHPEIISMIFKGYISDFVGYIICQNLLVAINSKGLQLFKKQKIFWIVMWAKIIGNFFKN